MCQASDKVSRPVSVREMEKMEDMTEEAVMERECSKELEILIENKFSKMLPRKRKR